MSVTARRLALGAVFLAGFSAVQTASAAEPAKDPTKRECVVANETGQDLRQSGKLTEARSALAVCMAERCPRPVREDCAQRLSEIEAALPTLVFAAKDGDGRDLSAVRVTVDGKPLLEALDGTATAIDPGEYLFTFEADGLPSTATSIVVREGDKNRRIQVVLGSSDAPLKEGAPPAPLTSSSSTADTSRPASSGLFGGSTQRTVGFALGVGGVVGVVTGAIFGIVSKSTYDHALHSECAGTSCSPSGAADGQTAIAEATVSTVAFIAGGALLVGGAVLYFTTPSGNVIVSPSVTAQGVGLGVHGSF